MSYLVQCDVCGVRVDADPHLVGQPIVCPECEGQFIVPITNIRSGLVEDDLWIQRGLGTGDIGEMFLAKRLSNSEKIYLKALSPAVTVEPQAVNAYLSNLLLAKDVSHPNLLPVQETATMGGLHVYIMPYREGTTIQEIVTRDGPMAEHDALKIILKAARCMRTIYEDRRLVHGSLKPGNIVVDDNGEPYLLELGSFKRTLAGSMLTLDHLNKAGTVADYMSPEQAQGWPQLDSRSDIYALGATLYFMLTGHKPYDGPDTRTVLHRHLNDDVPDPLALNSEISDPTVDLIFGMMDKNPDERLHSWREVVNEIKDILRNAAPGKETEVALKTQLHMQAVKAEHMNMAIQPRKSPAGLIIAACIGVLILALIIVGIAFAMMDDEPVADPPPVDFKRRVEERAAQDRNQPPETMVNNVLAKKIQNILRFHEKNPDKTDFAVERLQMLLAKDAKTAAEKKAVQQEIDRIKGSGNNPVVPDKGDNQQAEKSKEAKQIRDFAFLGPLSHDPEKTWGYVKPSTSRGLPNLKLRIKSKDGKSEVGWERLYPAYQAGRCDLRNDMFKRSTGMHAYAVTTITARRPTKARLALGFDDELTVWLNNEKVFHRKGVTREDSAVQEIQLQKGVNVLIVRCVNEKKSWWFSLRVWDRNSKEEPAGLTVNAPVR